MNFSPSRRAGVLPAAFLLLVFQSTAHAHLVLEGAGEIGNGALHPLVSPAHVMILLGLSLLLGQRVPFDLKNPMLVFAPVSALALLLSTTGRIASVPLPILIGIALCAAIAVALGRRPPWPLVGVICAAAAIGIGLDSRVESGTSMVIAKTLIGTWLSMNAVVAYTAVCASNGADNEWARIGIRVVGSWIIAISLLVLAFSLKKN